MQEGQNEKGFFGSSHCYVCFLVNVMQFHI